jgi:cytochrome c-type biogenesis protein CcmE
MEGMMTKGYAFLAVALLAAVPFAGCDYLPFGYTPIKEIVAAPANFEGKEVRLNGKVKDITKLPILDLKSFTLQDGTGEITVTTQGNLPAVNDNLTLKGTVKSAVIIGGQSLGLRVEETQRLR